MMLLAVGCNFRDAPVDLRERVAFGDSDLPAALNEISVRYGCEVVILSTCNRVELYLARITGQAPMDGELLAEFLSEWHKVSIDEILPVLYTHANAEAVRHLFRVAASLDSLIVGEGQIAGQVKRAYELAQKHATTGPMLHTLFQQARIVARRVRTETGIAQGRVSVSSAAVDYVRQVFSHFDDKTILVIGAGKMGELTLKHLRQLRPRRILVTNRSFEKAESVAQSCCGTAVPWDSLDDALAKADIVLSTTGAPEVIVSWERYHRIQAKRGGGPVVILDIAVPRDFDPRIHDGERTCLFNIDDLKRIRDKTIAERQRHLAPAEAVVEQELRRFLKDWQRRKVGPIIAGLTRDMEVKRQQVVRHLADRLGNRVSPKDWETIEGAFRLFQNQILHGPISALSEEAHEGAGQALLDALRKLFRLQD
jgi:glutamyl-tRNA reductase